MGHWIDPVSDIPETARYHFRRYFNIRQAWEQCEDGVSLIYLARHFGSMNDREFLPIAAGLGVSELRDQLDAHCSGGWKDDPFVRAYRDVIVDVAIAMGAEPKWPYSNERANPTDRYGFFRDQARRIVADALRAELCNPGVTTSRARPKTYS
jgi:hypothetical protein